MTSERSGVVRTFRCPPQIMPDSDPFPRMKWENVRVLLGGLSPHGFVQHNKTIFFYRDRDELRDIFFIQKMRFIAIALRYGVMRRPDNPD